MNKDFLKEVLSEKKKLLAENSEITEIAEIAEIARSLLKSSQPSVG